MNHNAYLRRLRVRWMLSQAQLADLLGVRQAQVSRYEQGAEHPSLPAILGLQVIFGRAPRTMFGGIYAAVEDAIMGRGAELERQLSGKRDAVSMKQRQLLTAMMQRATSTPSA